RRSSRFSDALSLALGGEVLGPRARMCVGNCSRLHFTNWISDVGFKQQQGLDSSTSGCIHPCHRCSSNINSLIVGPSKFSQRNTFQLCYRDCSDSTLRSRFVSWAAQNLKAGDGKSGTS